jgi:hypothetical protein
MSYDFIHGCVLLAIIAQNIFVHFTAYEQSAVIKEMRDREFENWKKAHKLETEVKELKNKLSSKS